MGKEKLSFQDLLLIEEAGPEPDKVIDDVRVVAGLLSNCRNYSKAERYVRYNMNRETSTLVIMCEARRTRRFKILTECVEVLYHLDFLNEELENEGCHTVTLSPAGVWAVEEEYFFGIPRFVTAESSFS